MSIFLGNVRSYDFGFLPGRLSRAIYSLTADSVVTQFLPIFVPQTVPSLTSKRRVTGASPLSLAAFEIGISSLSSGWFGPSLFVLPGIWRQSFLFSVFSFKVSFELRRSLAQPEHLNSAPIKPRI